MSFLQLLRHGAHKDVGVRLTGRVEDGGLTPAGRAQVAAAVQLLAAAPPTALYASPRRRTQETAALVATHFGLTVRTNAAIDEIDFGDWQGMTFEALASDPRWDAWNARRSSARPPCGESQSEAQARALAFAIEVAATDERPLLVTHCDIIRSLVCWSERRSLDDIHSVNCEPGSVTRIDVLADQRKAA